MPAFETTSAGAAAVKIFGVPVIAGAAATALTFCFMWPKTRHEAFIRFTCSILTSIILGPICMAALHSWWPDIFVSAKAIAAMEGLDPAMGMLVVAGPVMMLAGLPAWWLLGGVVLWLERRRGKDIAEIAHDAADAVKDVRGAL
ncbi:hypothetical protein GJ700_12765 [Duganella sp. FT92W]|uniref:Uncharacterized protein n=1 Tax=Pseudoduganella rivuli TaxID=2666085 RepID=A0A7X2IMH7_9BURK|nr:hypothetical protein [Pseudoduganella rivuli]MRV72580.1 hypothetical protein [Pseudoduganella rivuli]